MVSFESILAKDQSDKQLTIVAWDVNAPNQAKLLQCFSQLNLNLHDQKQSY